MNKNKVGRPKIYFSEEERRTAQNCAEAKYCLNTNWYCDICKNNKNYKICWKQNHLNTQKHQRNVNITKNEVLEYFLQFKQSI